MSKLLLAWGFHRHVRITFWVHGIEPAVYRRRGSGRGHLRNRNHPVTIRGDETDETDKSGKC